MGTWDCPLYWTFSIDPIATSLGSQVFLCRQLQCNCPMFFLTERISIESPPSPHSVQAAKSRTIQTLDRSHPPYFLGIDVGGTNIKIGVVDDQGQTLAYQSIVTEEPRGPADAMCRVVETVRGMIRPMGLALENIARVGLGTPGSQDIPRGMIVEPPTTLIGITFRSSNAWRAK